MSKLNPELAGDLRRFQSELVYVATKGGRDYLSGFDTLVVSATKELSDRVGLLELCAGERPFLARRLKRKYLPLVEELAREGFLEEVEEMEEVGDG